MTPLHVFSAIVAEMFQPSRASDWLSRSSKISSGGGELKLMSGQARRTAHVRDWEWSGKHLLSLRLTGFDPLRAISYSPSGSPNRTSEYK
jgi:hypothetical protein